MNEHNYIEAKGVFYPGALRKTKKSTDILQPLFEAVTNSLEAIKALNQSSPKKNTGEIQVDLFFSKDLHSKENDEVNFREIKIIDSGIGFNDTEFDRLVSLYNDTKGFSNKGSGRLQFLHFFKETKITSVYRDEKSSTEFKKRVFTLSKEFIKKSAIIRKDKGNETETKSVTPGTTLSFIFPWLDKDRSFYDKLNEVKLKQGLIEHYLSYFCENRETLPKIKIRKHVDEKMVGESEINLGILQIPVYTSLLPSR